MAGWQQQERPTRSTRGNGSEGSPKKSTTGKTACASSLSLAQARLDRISQPTAAYWTSYVRWWRSVPRMDTEILTERLAGISRDIEALCRLVATPPPEWTGAFFLSMESRLRGWQGQAAAISEEIARR